MRPYTRYTIIFSTAIFTLFLIGSFFPGPLTWGFHFLAYLPLPYNIAYAIVGIAGISLLLRKSSDRVIENLLRKASARPYVTLGITILFFIVTAIVLRIQVPLLGDSFIAIKLFQNRAGGQPFLANSHYPLSFFYFFSFMKFLGAFSFPRVMDAFLLGEIILCAGFIVVVWYVTRMLFENIGMQVLSFFLLLALHSMQLFFGYVEIYALPFFFLSAYTLAAILYLRGAISFAIVSGIFSLLVLSHYLNMMILPSLFYLGVRAFKQDGIKPISVSAGVVASIILLVLSFSQLGIDNFIPASRHNPLLSITSVEDIYQAYTLFSPYHVLDLINLLVFICPAGVFLFLISSRKKTGDLFSDRIARFLLIAVIPAGIFFALAKFDLPMAQDWDIIAPYAFLLTLLGIFSARQWLSSSPARVFCILIIVTLLNSATWFYVNASVQPALQRATAFIDKRVSSQDGAFQSTLHLAEYFSLNDTAEAAKAFERFLEMYPGDKRAYSNYALYLMQLGKQMDDKVIAIFEQWLGRDPENAEARTQYANFLFDIGQRSYNESNLTEAAKYFSRSIQLNPSFAEPYNGMGIIHKRMGNPERARQFYEHAIEIEPANIYAHINLGNLYDERNMTQKAIEYYGKAISLQPNDPTAHFNIGITYYRAGANQQAQESIQHAARLGMRDAQEFLSSKGERW